MKILITGGAGFVGSSVALDLRRELASEVLVLDNLRRRGAELNLDRLNRSGIRFVHGDIRIREDLDEAAGSFDVLIEASAEPSVHAGQRGSPAYVIGTNLGGTINCLEFARKRAGAFLFLSSSRVYSIESLRQIRLEETPDRFEIAPEQTVPGVSSAGISEQFPVRGARSFYGATKLCSEFLIEEYVASYGLKAIVNRCGVVAGPGQFGKADQGVYTMWVANHYFGIPLQYTGFGGGGKQVRDLLHPADLSALIIRQIEAAQDWRGQTCNVGGGRAVSISLKEMTDLCRRIVGRPVPVGAVGETTPNDVPLYLTDLGSVSRQFGWKPQRGVESIVTETLEWLRANEASLRPVFCKSGRGNGDGAG